MVFQLNLPGMQLAIKHDESLYRNHTNELFTIGDYVN